MSVIGIDLGTTTSEIAIFKNDKAQIIKNVAEGDSTIIPSVVLIEGKKITVGIKAKNQMILKAKNTVAEVKRLMGTDEKLKVDGKQYTPVEISSFILKKLKEVAEFYTGDKVEEAVITVPASFSDKARKDTKEAGRLAGLKVERIINEPTAAAIAYGIDKLDRNMKILVYDFGGGTLDVTVMELFDGVLDIKSSRGGNIGGKDIDEHLMEYLIQRFYYATGQNLDIGQPRILSTLKSVSEECKKNLSFQKEWEVIVPYITRDEDGNPLDMDIVITEEELSGLTEDIIKSTEDIMIDALNGAGFRTTDIDKVILVGGSTRMPSVRKMIESRFGVDKIVTGINPEETVALGASIQAAIKERVINDSDIIVMDSTSHTLGVEVLGGRLDPIIPRDTKLPARITKIYKTVEDGQTEAEINVYEGEEEDVTKDYKLDSVEIYNIPRGPKGKELLQITFSYDLNGILGTDVVVMSTGEEKIQKIQKPLPKKAVDNKSKSGRRSETQPTRTESKVRTEPEIRAEQNVKVRTEPEIRAEKNVNEGAQPDIGAEPRVNAEQRVNAAPRKDKKRQPRANSGEKAKTPVNSEPVKINVKNEKVRAKYELIPVRDEDVPDEEDEDYSTVFNEVTSLTKYVNKLIDGYSEKDQKILKSNLAELLEAVKADRLRRCRYIEHKILMLMGIE